MTLIGAKTLTSLVLLVLTVALLGYGGLFHLDQIASLVSRMKQDQSAVFWVGVFASFDIDAASRTGRCAQET